MIRDNAFGLAAIAAAILSIGGALAVVEAQQPPSADNRPAKAGATKARPDFRRFTDSEAPVAFPRAAGLGAPPGMSPMTMSGMPGMMAAADDDPEMSELAQAEALLANKASEIIAEYAEAENAAERKPIAAELRQVLAKQFDVQKQRRELELTRIEERVRRLREQIKKRDDARETIIDRRLAQLVDDADGLGWTPPAGETRRGKTPAGSSSGGFKTKNPELR